MIFVAQLKAIFWEMAIDMFFFFQEKWKEKELHLCDALGSSTDQRLLRGRDLSPWWSHFDTELTDFALLIRSASFHFTFDYWRQNKRKRRKTIEGKIQLEPQNMTSTQR